MATMVLPANIQQQAATRRCRFCGTGLQRTFVDLGLSPLCETYPAAADFNRGEVYYPLHVYVCENVSWCNWRNTRARRIFSATMLIFLPTRIPG